MSRGEQRNGDTDTDSTNSDITSELPKMRARADSCPQDIQWRSQRRRAPTGRGRARPHSSTYNLPMLEVAGGDGPRMVFRPWTETEIKEAMLHLPHPRDSGRRFAEEFRIFCQEFSPTVPELRRLLALKLGAVDWAKISGQFPRRRHLDCADGHNEDYLQTVIAVCTAIETAFPPRMDSIKITACKQREDETVSDFLAHLTDIFNRHSGLEQPTELGATATVWEAHLRDNFIRGLRTDVQEATKVSCVGWDEQRLDEVRRHAVHAENTIKT